MSVLTAEDVLPQSVKDLLEGAGVGDSQVKFSLLSDLTQDGDFGSTWLVATEDMIYIFHGYEEPGQGKGNKGAFHIRDLETLLFSDLEKIWTEDMIGGGMLLVKKGEEEQVLLRYTNALARSFNRAARILDKLRRGEELTTRDLSIDAPERNCPSCGTPYSDPRRKVCPKCMDKRSIFRRVLSYGERYKFQIALLLICMLASSAVSLMGPFLSGRILFDEVLTPGGRYEGQVGFIVLTIFGANLISLIIRVIYGRLNAGMTAQIVFDIKSDVFQAMQRLSLGFFTARETGGLMTRVNSDATQLQHFFLDGMPYFIVNAVNLVGIAIILISMNLRLTLLVLIPAPFVVFLIRKLYPKIWTIYSRRFRSTSALNSVINDSLTGMRVVKAFGREEEEVLRFNVRNDALFHVSMEAGHLNSTIFPLISFFMGIGSLVVWALGGWQVVSGTMTFGTLMTFIGYLGMFYGPLDFMTNAVNWWSSCMNSAQRIFEILDSVPEITEAPDAVRLEDMKGAVELSDVTFGYEKTKPVLTSVNIKVEPGEMIGVVGHSGAGKSTLINLIARLYDVDSGIIYIDGIDVRKIVIRDLRSQIGIVLQETYLFNGSIGENIAYANPHCHPEEIVRAAKIANAHDFIMKLPDGYDTVIGRKGLNLSGGERQRVAIARAILHNPKILILDEATASVDTETEQQIQEALERLVEGRTTFAIAHRLSTLRNADRLLVLERGKVVEHGTHDELLEKKGVYFNLVKIQREGMRIRGFEEEFRKGEEATI